MKKDIVTLPIKEALEKVKADCKCKFDSSVEVHVNLGIDPRKADQIVRFTTVLPNGTGKTKKVAVFAESTVEIADINLTEEDLVKIERGKLKPKVDFDVIVAQPRYMPKLAKAARILGPAGVMPSPKAGTVTDDVTKAVEQIKKGKIEVKNEQNAPLAHTIIGKRSFSTKDLIENFSDLMSAFNSNRPVKAKATDYIRDVFVCTTMSPAVRVKLEE